MQTPDSTSFNSDITSGSHTSIWTATADTPEYASLSSDTETDVLIIGGGVAGIMTAYALAREGRSVTVVEDGFLGSGETGRTTAHLTYVLDDRFTDLKKLLGEEKAKRVTESHRDAIQWIRKTVEENNIDCHFETVDGYLFAHPTDTEESLRYEFELTQRMGFPTEMCTTIPLLRDAEKSCIRFPEQAQFHSLLYIRGLAEAIVRLGGKIFTQSKATEVTTAGATVNGFNIKASHVIDATNATIRGSLKLNVQQWAYRTYAIAVKIPKRQSYALIWDTGDLSSPWVEKPYHYLRFERGDADFDYLIVGGEDHRTGQEDKEDVPYEMRYLRLYDWAKALFPDMTEIAARWSGQIMASIDGCGFIGRNPGEDNMYFISGDSGNGMTNAAIAAMLIPDLIAGRTNQWEDLYDPARSVIDNAPLDYIREAGNMVGQYGSWLTPGDKTTEDALQPGTGAVIRKGLKKVAVYCDETGQMHSCSAVCPHLGAILVWNADEKTFDCPAHGSRFTATGKVVNGPANDDLSPE